MEHISNRKQPEFSPSKLVNLMLRDEADPWIFKRPIKNPDNTTPPFGTATGTATFTTLQPGQFLYSEKGTFRSSADLHTNTPFVSPFERKYIWSPSDAANTLSVYFVKPRKTSTANDSTQPLEEIDYLFHDISLEAPECTDEDSKDRDVECWRLTGSHLCVNDTYESTYSFYVRGGNSLVSWEMQHKITGPKKNQVIVTKFTRTEDLCPIPRP